MRSVSFFSFSKSYWSTLTCLRISSQASCGMIFSFAWARARPASKSRYFWMRLPSDHTCRMASVPKMSLKMAESMVPVGMAGPFRKSRQTLSLASAATHGEGRDRRRDHSGLMPVLATSARHFAVSSRDARGHALAAVPGSGSKPCFCRFSTMSGSFRISFIARLSLPTIASGVPAGVT